MITVLPVLVLAAVLAGAAAKRRISDVTKSSCQYCPEMVSLSRHVGLEWEIFPPHPLPQVEVAMVCLPNPRLDWGPGAAKQVDDALLDEDCGVGAAAEGLSSNDRKSCQEQYVQQSKRASWLGLPVAFLQQMAVCGRCAVCNAFAKVRELWRKLKSAMKKVVGKLSKIKRKLFGYSYASSRVRKAMKKRINSYFPEPGASVLQVSEDSEEMELEKVEAVDAEAVKHERLVEEHLTKHLKNKPAAAVDEHMALLQSKLDEMEKNEQATLRTAQQEFMAKAAANRRKLEQQLPTMLNNEDCQEVMQASMESKVLGLTLYITFPDLMSAILHAVIGNLIGALHALVPEISIVAVPTGGHMEDVHVERCLEAVRDARQPYLDICTHEQPLAACTARTFQRLMQGALSQKWWPLIHNAEGTPGSIDLGYKYDELMDALACSSKGSCLEKGLGDLDSEDLKSVLENGTTSERERFAELQCSFAGNRVDTEDSETGKLPVFSDKIWIAALKAHGASMEMEPSEVHPCPRVVPFVVAFCASSLGCMEDADNAGKGFYELPDFQNARSRAEEELASIYKLTPSSVAQWVPKEGKMVYNHSATPARKRLESFWTTMVNSPYADLTPADDAFQWNLLWRTANFTNKVGLLKSWPEIVEALSAGGGAEVDWLATRGGFWERIAFVIFARLNARQAHELAAENERSLVRVTRNLLGLWETKLCSPGALGGLKEEHLRRLGVQDLVSVVLARFDKDFLVESTWKKWKVLHVKLPKYQRASAKKFSQLLANHSCSCMCYDQCGKLEASALVACNPLSAGSPEDESEMLEPRIYAEKIVVDRVHKTGKVYEYAELLFRQLRGHGGCRWELVVRSMNANYNDITGFMSKCAVPQFFNQSKGKYDLTITLWDDENAVEPLDWANYKRAARVDYDDDSDSDFASDLSFDQDEFNSWLKEID